MIMQVLHGMHLGGTLAAMRCLGPVVALAGAALALGQEPDFQHYGRPEGLPHDQVRCLRQDERGYLWIASAGRVCRYDGSTIRQWPAEAPAPERIDRMAVAGDGRMFLGGLGPSIHSYDPGVQPCFTQLQLRGHDLGRNISALAVDGQKRLFAATETGLFVADLAGSTCSLRSVHRDERDSWYGALAVDDRGRLLYASSNLVVRIDGDQEIVVVPPRGHGNVWTVEAIEGERCRVLGDRWLGEVDFAARSCRVLSLPTQIEKRCTTMCTDRRGATWLGTVEGLWRFGPGVPATRVLADAWIQSLCVDRAGDVWVGTQQGGLLRASARPFTQLHGMGRNGVVRPVRLLRVEDAAFVASHTDGLFRVADGTLQPTPFSAMPELHTGSDVEADAFGNLWFATPGDLLQVARAGAAEGALDTRRWPIVGRRLCRDARGHVVCTTDDAVITIVPDAGGAMRQERLPLPPHLAGGVAMGGDGRGTVYYRTRSGELWRMSTSVVEPCVDRGDRLVVWGGCQDEDGRLWILPANRTGFAIVDPERGAALDPQWVDAASGLPGSRVLCLAPDEGHGVWIAFASALSHFDATTGRVASWPWPADVGLAGVNGMLVDPEGRVLVATDDHLVAFDPSAQLQTTAPVVLVTSLLVAGMPVALPDGGTSTLGPLAAPAGRGDFHVTFCAPGNRVGAAPVEFRLAPTSHAFGPQVLGSTLQLSSLAPGDYRLELRAAAIDGMEPGESTVVSLRVPQPLWVRPEFLAGITALSILLGVLLHRVRVRQLLAMESVRRQVATDLHDDLGSGLAQVAVLSEVAKQQQPLLAAVLEEIGGLARGMRESLSDIVWAVDPTQDTLAAVVQRLRQVASNLFGDGTTTLRWSAPTATEMGALTLRPDRRRHLFLFCKEALTNAALHAQARSLAIEIVRTTDGLRVALVDDGCGFQPGATRAGNGLHSLEARAVALGATLSLRSEPGRGTTIELTVPVV